MSDSGCPAPACSWPVWEPARGGVGARCVGCSPPAPVLPLRVVSPVMQGPTVGEAGCMRHCAHRGAVEAWESLPSSAAALPSSLPSDFHCSQPCVGRGDGPSFLLSILKCTELKASRVASKQTEEGDEGLTQSQPVWPAGRGAGDTHT